MCYASLAPTKDMEITILGDELTCPAFAGLLHGALRTLIDRLGALTFNVGILNISLEQDGAASQQQPVIARCELTYLFCTQRMSRQHPRSCALPSLQTAAQWPSEKRPCNLTPAGLSLEVP